MVKGLPSLESGVKVFHLLNVCPQSKPSYTRVKRLVSNKKSKKCNSQPCTNPSPSVDPIGPRSIPWWNIDLSESGVPKMSMIRYFKIVNRYSVCSFHSVNGLKIVPSDHLLNLVRHRTRVPRQIVNTEGMTGEKSPRKYEGRKSVLRTVLRTYVDFLPSLPTTIERRFVGGFPSTGVQLPYDSLPLLYPNKKKKVEV